VPDERSLARIQAEIQDLQEALFMGNDPYIVIDTVHNRLQIRRGDRILKEAVCSTGSGKVLLGKKREAWYFNTPKKVFQVQRKVEGPIWKKPKWAFVEQGQSAPVLPWDFSRLDPITLGKYALELGDGYVIHGNLYPNLIGRHITHGCIRLNDADLEAAYALTKTGSRVYIY
jgi:L,D-transpeptidase YbiS